MRILYAWFMYIEIILQFILKLAFRSIFSQRCVNKWSRKLQILIWGQCLAWNLVLLGFDLSLHGNLFKQSLTAKYVVCSHFNCFRLQLILIDLIKGTKILILTILFLVHLYLKVTLLCLSMLRIKFKRHKINSIKVRNSLNWFGNYILMNWIMMIEKCMMIESCFNLMT